MTTARRIESSMGPETCIVTFNPPGKWQAIRGCARGPANPAFGTLTECDYCQGRTVTLTPYVRGAPSIRKSGTKP